MSSPNADLSTSDASPAVEHWLPVPTYLITGVLVFHWLDRDVLGFLGALGWGCAAGQVASLVLPRLWVRLREAGFVRGVARPPDADGRLIARNKTDKRIP
ncbi:hypothetical protein [Gemmatimonas aurantiaca]|uniref:hypothetical protein n=1 Tax=Gemmatimonas aurantiaca TaxID=173480 RepID=UPI00301BA438